MMNTNEYRQAGRALDDEEQRLRALVHSLRATGLDNPETEALGDLSSYDQHPADHGSETFEREKDLGLLLDTYQQLEQVAKAKERLSKGDYATCEECGWPIAQARLEALPYATTCFDCKKRQESAQNNYHRPVEEEVLSPPFGRVFYRQGPGFDGEDAWQAVAKFGTANSPQDVPDSVEFDDAYLNADEDEGIVEATDGIIDVDYRRVSDQDEIYPDLEDNPRRLPHKTDMLMPGDFSAGESRNTGELDQELWEFIQKEFPDDPEMEIAEVLTPERIAELSRETDDER